MANEPKKAKVVVIGARCRALLQPDAPMWDPKNERLRA
jgi:dimethylglycine dehydrogenase